MFVGLLFRLELNVIFKGICGQAGFSAVPEWSFLFEVEFHLQDLILLVKATVGPGISFKQCCTVVSPTKATGFARNYGHIREVAFGQVEN